MLRINRFLVDLNPAARRAAFSFLTVLIAFGSATVVAMTKDGSTAEHMVAGCLEAVQTVVVTYLGVSAADHSKILEHIGMRIRGNVPDTPSTPDVPSDGAKS